MNITAEARREAHELIKPKKEKLLNLVVSVLYKNEPMTAQEISQVIKGRNWKDIINSVRPRLTEGTGKFFEVVYKKKLKCARSACSVYVLKNGN